jgi:hypothetical protein
MTALTQQGAVQLADVPAAISIILKAPGVSP